MGEDTIPLLKDLTMYWIIHNRSLIQESPGLKPHYFLKIICGEKDERFVKKESLPNFRSKEAGR